MRYELQINEWTDWVADRCFDTDVSAKLYARERYAQNEWRVYDKIARRVVHQHDPSEAFQEMAGADLNRFHRVAEWTESHRRRMDQQQRAAELERRRNSTLQRLHRVASRLPRSRQILEEDFLCFTPAREEKVNWLQEGF